MIKIFDVSVRQNADYGNTCPREYRKFSRDRTCSYPLRPCGEIRASSHPAVGGRSIQDGGGARAPSRGSAPRAASAERVTCVCVRAILTFFASISGK